MKNIFISYRREESADVTGRISDRLREYFGNECIFTDVDNIPIGLDFRSVLDNEVKRCAVLLAVVGPDWLNVRNDQDKLRLFDDSDFVRIEIESALRRNVPVVPLLVRGSAMPPSDELPESLKDFSYRHAIAIRSDPDFHNDIDRLIAGLDRHLTKQKSKKSEAEKNDGEDKPAVAHRSTTKEIQTTKAPRSSEHGANHLANLKRDDRSPAHYQVQETIEEKISDNNSKNRSHISYSQNSSEDTYKATSNVQENGLSDKSAKHLIWFSCSIFLLLITLLWINNPTKSSTSGDFNVLNKPYSSKVTIAGETLFSSNSAELSSGSVKGLRNLLDQLDNFGAISEMRVEGHTDSAGDESYNMGLSEKRANSVRQYLVKYYPNTSITAIGKGESSPIATNSTREGRSLNRRVEIRVIAR